MDNRQIKCIVCEKLGDCDKMDSTFDGLVHPECIQTYANWLNREICAVGVDGEPFLLKPKPPKGQQTLGGN